MESSEDGAAHAEPPDADVLEVDPTCRYIRVLLWLFYFCSLIFLLYLKHLLG